MPQLVPHLPPHGEGAQSNSASGEAGKSARQTQHGHGFISIVSCSYLWPRVWQLLGKHYCEIDVGQNKDGSFNVSRKQI